MIVKHFDCGWKDVQAVTDQNWIIDTYLQKFINDDSHTILINTTWIKNENDIDQIIKNYYNTFVGADWPSLEDILDDQGIVTEELRNFKETLDIFKNQEMARKYSGYPYVLEYINNNKEIIDNIIIYNLVDPPCELNEILEPIITIGYFPKSKHWIDLHAILVSKYFFVDPGLNSKNLDIPFMCLNGKPQYHRQKIVNKLIDLNLLDKGFVTFGGNPRLTITEEYKPKQGINADPFDAMTLGDIRNWNRHFLNIVTETVWEVEAVNFWSEKIFKPIVGLRPFLVYAPNGAATMLEQHGFKHYCDDFKDIIDLDLRDPNNIPAFLEILSKQPTEYFDKKYSQLSEKIQYNRMRFDQHVVEQLTKIESGYIDY